MSSNIWLKDGIYDPTKRFAFTNIDSEPFTFTWGGKPITVKAGETVELRHHLAVLATTRLVDKIMMDEQNAKTAEMKKINPMYLAPNQAGSLGVPAARAPYEAKVLRELPPREDNDAQLNVIRAELKDELQKDLSGEKAPPITKMSDLGVSGLKEFEDINLPNSK